MSDNGYTIKSSGTNNEVCRRTNRPSRLDLADTHTSMRLTELMLPLGKPLLCSRLRLRQRRRQFQHVSLFEPVGCALVEPRPLVMQGTD